MKSHCDSAARIISSYVWFNIQAGYQHSLVLASIKDKVEEAIEPETKQDKPVVPSVGLTAQESLMSGLDLSPLYQTFPGFIFKEKGSDAVRLNPFSYLERQVSTQHCAGHLLDNGIPVLDS